MEKIKNAIESNPGRSMIVTSIIGLAFPYGPLIPDYLIVISLSIMIFLSCFKIDKPIHTTLSSKLLIFWVMRFIALPIALWAVCKQFAPDYALGILLLGLCPAGASSAGLTGLYNGNVTLALLITIISNIASVLLIPLVIGTLHHTVIDMPILGLLKTLSICILLPGALYLLLRRRAALIRYSRNYGRLTMVVLLSLITFLVITKKRDYFLTHPQDILVPLLIGFVLYAVAIIYGFSLRGKNADRIAYSVCSTFNNTALGIGLALLYFDEKTIILMIATEITWALLPAIMQPLLRRLPSD